MEVTVNKELEDLVDSLTEPYTHDLDVYLQTVRKDLKELQQFSTEDIETIVLELPTMIYFLITCTEHLGIQEDFAKLKRGEVYNKALRVATGKVDEKRASAEDESQAQALIHLIFSRAYKIMKSKIEYAQDILNSFKKVLTLRISETDLSNNRYGGSNNDK